MKSGEGTFKYKGCTTVPPLSFIDDVLGITECSVKSVQLNTIIQSKMNNKKLRLSQSKCYKMHVGKSSESCPSLKVDVKEIKAVDKESSLEIF